MKIRFALLSLVAVLSLAAAAPAWAHTEQGKAPHSEQGRGK